MNRPRTILALDASAAACSVALWRAGAIAGHRFRPMLRGHAEALMPMVLEVLAEARTGFGDLDAVAVTVGPGAFTGLRIALAAARGMALAAGLPVIGVTSFATVAEAVPVAERRDRSLLVLLDSKRADLYAQCFGRDLSPSSAAVVIAPSAIAGLLPPEPVVLAGDGVGLIEPSALPPDTDITISTVQGPPDAAALARLAVRLAGLGGALPPSPLYLRAPEVRLPPALDHASIDPATAGRDRSERGVDR